MRVLITGGAGFIGGFLAKALLEREVPVDLLDNFARAVKDPFLVALHDHPLSNLLTCDLSDAQEVAKLSDEYTHIVHLAAIVGVPNVMKQPYRVLHDNILLTFAAIDLAKRQKNLERFVFASTSEVVAGTLESFGIPIPTPETVPLTITDPAAPRATYLLSKITGESLCYHSGLPFTAVRPHNIYGPRMGMSHVIPQQLQKAHHYQDGDKVEVFSPTHRRCFCYIDDAVEKVIRLMTSEGGQGVFNLGNQQPEITIRELVERVVKVVGRDVNLVDGQEHPGSPARRCPDMTRTDSVTGYESQVDLEEGIRRTYAWYREHVFEGDGITAS